MDCNLSPLETNTVPRWNLTDEELHRQINTNEMGHAVPWNTLTQGQRQFQAAKMAIHAAMVHRMDIEIGRVLEQIKAMGALDNALIFFVSDNGASSEQILRGDGNDEIHERAREVRTKNADCTNMVGGSTT
ncbi:MAG: sulfatase-like hydrolase/transferase [Verrucomicrobiota bacterium]